MSVAGEGNDLPAADDRSFRYRQPGEPRVRRPDPSSVIDRQEDRPGDPAGKRHDPGFGRLDGSPELDGDVDAPVTGAVWRGRSLEAADDRPGHRPGERAR